MKNILKIPAYLLAILIAVIVVWLFGRGSIKIGGIPSAKENNINVFNAIKVTKVIDGDTIIVAGGTHIRLLGIDTDEKGYPCYDAARLRLEELILNKDVILESDNEDADQYGRKLRYVFLDGNNINEELVAQGLAVARFYPENQKYKSQITIAEKTAMENKSGCKWEKDYQSEKLLNAGVIDDKNIKWEKLNGDNIIDICQAGNYIGRPVLAQGYVAEAYLSENKNLFLNFGKGYPDNCFVAVIFESDLKSFGREPAGAYAGKIIRISGTVNEYQGKPEIILKNPNQIEVGSIQ